jgi:ADP-heptose:LPS heptosyltransferase
MVAPMINRTCRHYRGSKPCKFNKLDGSECPTCGHVSVYASRVLIIKLDALGDVLRTGSLLPVIAARHDAPYICWLTRPEAVPLVSMMHGVDEVIPLNPESLARIGTGSWDYVYALSNDYPTASLATLAAPRNPPIGYSVRNGVLHPSNEAAARWLEMAAFDRLKRANTEPYQKIMLDIIGENAEFGPPRLEVDDQLLKVAREQVSSLFGTSNKRRVAINIGAGGRWPKKMLDARQISEYAAAARSRLNVDIVLVGGPAEASKAQTILELCGPNSPVRTALTADSLPEFVAVLSQADVLLCGDTLALHVATAIQLPTVCVIGPTSNAELADFGGLVAKTSVSGLDCLGCYGDCQKTQNCMSLFEIEKLVDLTAHQLSRAPVAS